MTKERTSIVMFGHWDVSFITCTMESSCLMVTQSIPSALAPSP